MTPFEYALAFTLKWEGGYVNDKADPGGETKFGISKHKYPNLDIGALTLPAAVEIYYRDYWQPKAASLPMPLAMVAFDIYVNHSYATAKMLLRDIPDWQTVIQRRKDFRGQRVQANPTQEKFLTGWLNRDNDLWKAAKIWEQDNA